MNYEQVLWYRAIFLFLRETLPGQYIQIFNTLLDSICHYLIWNFSICMYICVCVHAYMNTVYLNTIFTSFKLTLTGVRLCSLHRMESFPSYSMVHTLKTIETNYCFTNRTNFQE